MTSITITAGAGRWRFEASGHATGSPEACSAVSALLYALAGWLRNAPPGVRPGRTYLAPAAADIAFSDAGSGGAAEAVADCIAVGLLQVASAEPGAVRVRVVQA